jgi:hypothetical protein
MTEGDATRFQATSANCENQGTVTLVPHLSQ